jgi:adenylate cyclase
VLPFLREDFEEASVRAGGEAWIARFQACLDKAASVTFATRMEYVHDDGQFAYGAMLAMGLAQLRARQIATEAVQIAVWDGQPARGQSGAAVDVATWRGLGLGTRVIDPGPIDRAIERLEPLVDPDRSARAVRAIIFSHYRGYSQLAEAALPAFIHEVMGRIAQVLNRHDDAVCGRNTWVDALYVVVTDPVRAATIALEIVEALKDVVIDPAGTEEQQGIGIGLHFGPIYQEVDRVTGLDGFYGSEVTLTARIEPKTVPGEIFTTQAFAAILAVTEPSRFASRYVGQVKLAKGYGVAPIYRLERRR